MKKIFSILVLLTLIGFVACKKGEEQKPAEGVQAPQAQKQVQPSDTFKPRAKKDKTPAAAKNPPLQIFNGANLVATIQPAEYPAVAKAKITVGRKQVSAVLLRDLLNQYKLTGKKVDVSGDIVSASFTWDQITGNDVYVFVTPKKFLKVYAPAPALNKIKLPKRVEKITVS